MVSSFKVKIETKNEQDFLTVELIKHLGVTGTQNISDLYITTKVEY